MMARDKKVGRQARLSKEDLIAKLQKETQDRKRALEAAAILEQQETFVPLEAWKIPVPLFDHDPDLASDSATCAAAVVHCDTSINSNLIVESCVAQVGRLITVAMITGEEVPFVVQPTETVHSLATRVALMKGGGRAKLLLDQASLTEDSLVQECVPCGCIVTAILQFGFNLPTTLDPIMQQQIRLCYELWGAKVASGHLLDDSLKARFTEASLDLETFWRVAFEKQSWEEFTHHIGAQDFQIRAFSFGLNPFNQTRFFYFSFDMGNYAYGTVHVENEVSCIAVFNLKRSAEDHFPGERFEAPVQPHQWHAEKNKFLEGLDFAAYAKSGVEKYGFW